MDNQFSSNHLCFIVSQSDTMKIKEFLAEHPRYESKLASESQERNQLEDSKKKINATCDKKKESQKGHEAEQAKARKAAKKIATSYRKLTKKKKIPSRHHPETAEPAKKKRKKNDNAAGKL